MTVYSLEEWFNLPVEEKYKINNVNRFIGNPNYIKLLRLLDDYLVLLDALGDTSSQFEVGVIYKNPMDNLNIKGHKLYFFRMLSNLQSTLLSIKSCLQLFNISDSMILLRKLKDDFGIIIHIIYLSQVPDDIRDRQDEENALLWMSEKGFRYNRNKINKKIFSIPSVELFNKKFNCEKKFKGISEQLNMYGHSNGMCFFNKETYSNDDKVNEAFLEILKIFEEIMVLNISILFLVCSKLFRALNYEFSIKKGNEDKSLKNLVASFFDNYVNKHIFQYNKEMAHYIKTVNKMKFN